MADINLEKMLLEAVKHIINQDDLGMVKDGMPIESEHHTQFQWEEIQTSFALKVKNSDFFDSLTSAFYKVHANHWICDSAFPHQLRDELHSQGVPEIEINKALKAIESLNKEYTDNGNKNENAVGWPNMADMRKVSQEFGNKPISKGETFKGDNKPPLGVEPKNTRPVSIK